MPHDGYDAPLTDPDERRASLLAMRAVRDAGAHSSSADQRRPGSCGATDHAAAGVVRWRARGLGVVRLAQTVAIRD